MFPKDITYFNRMSQMQNMFKMTPRRLEVLWHIAYDGDLRMVPMRDFSKPWVRDGIIYVPHLVGVNVYGIVKELKKAGLIRYSREIISHDPIITPFGMEILLNGIPQWVKDKDTYLLGFDTDGQPAEAIDTPEYAAMKHNNTPYIEMVEKSTEDSHLINIETGETE